MGWDSIEGATRADVIREVTRPRPDSNWAMIRHCVVDNVIYGIVEVTRPGQPPERFIDVVLIDEDPGFGWALKRMDESVGPYAYDCPLEYLDEVPSPGGYADEWRARVRACCLLVVPSRVTTPR